MKKNRLRLLFCSYGGNVPFDPLFLDMFAKAFETYLVTFLPLEQIAKSDARIIQLRDLRRQSRYAVGTSNRMNTLTILLSTFWRAIQVHRCVRAMKPHLIIGNWATTYGLYARLSKQRPFILFAYGSDILVDPYRSVLHRAITIDVVKSADLVLIDSEVQRRAVLRLGCSPEKIISFAWFDERNIQGIEPDPTLRQTLGWTHNVIVVCVRDHEPKCLESMPASEGTDRHNNRLYR